MSWRDGGQGQTRLVKTCTCVLVNNLLEVFSGEKLTPELLLYAPCLQWCHQKHKWEEKCKYHAKPHPFNTILPPFTFSNPNP